MNRCAKHHRRSIRLKGYDYARPGIYFVTICVQNRECLFGNVVQGEMQLNAAGEMVVRWFAQLENKFATVQCDASICMPNHVHFVVHNRGSSVDGIDVGADLRVCPVSNAHQRLLQPGRTHGSAPTGAIDDGTGVGADLRVCPVSNDHQRLLQSGRTHGSAPTGTNDDGTGVGADLCVCPVSNAHQRLLQPGRTHGSAPTRANDDGTGVGADLRVCPVSNGHQRLLQPGRTHGSAPTGANDDRTGVGADLCVCPVPLSQIVQWFKTMTTNEYIRGIKQKDWPRFSGKLWQRNYWEHIVRDQSEWDRIRDYIHNNPAQWDQDRLNDRKTMVREPVCEYSGENWRV